MGEEELPEHSSDTIKWSCWGSGWRMEGSGGVPGEGSSSLEPLERGTLLPEGPPKQCQRGKVKDL